MDALVHGIPRGEEQHRNLHAGFAQAAQHLPAVEAGEHHVEDDQVVLAGKCQRAAFEAVGGEVGGKSGLGHALAQELAGLGFVFDYQ
ncbi:hypothetical protein D3C84_649070 [compost metagenome]